MEKTLAYLNKLSEVIDSGLKRYLMNNEPQLRLLYKSIDYSLFAGGKRLRPIFCLIVGELFNVPQNRLISTACAIEMIHTASLIIDDLPHMDDAKLRRGKTANHLIYGQDIATLASIGLLAKAYEVISDDPLLPQPKKTGIISGLAKAVGLGGMVAGQFVDLKFADKTMEYWTLEYIYRHKTTSLFVASGSAAALIGDAADHEIRAIEEYAENLGFAFQATDDLLDRTGTVHAMGKVPQNDEGNYFTFYGVEECRQRIADLTNKAREAARIFDGRNERLLSFAELLMNRKS